jgi:hypothetical protein
MAQIEMMTQATGGDCITTSAQFVRYIVRVYIEGNKKSQAVLGRAGNAYDS